MNQEQVSAEPMGELGRLGGVLFDPKPAFADIAARPVRWWVPLLLLTILNLAFVFGISQRIGWEQVVRKAIESNPQAMERIPADRREEVIRQQVSIVSVTTYISGVLGFTILTLILAGVFLFVFNLLAGASDVRFRQAFAIISYALLPFALWMVVGAVMMFVQSPTDFDVQNPVTSNLAVFLDPDTTPRWLLSVLGSVDAFNIWVLLLIATGFSAAARKMPWGRAFGWVLAAWLLYVLGKGGISWIFS